MKINKLTKLSKFFKESSDPEFDVDSIFSGGLKIEPEPEPEPEQKPEQKPQTTIPVATMKEIKDTPAPQPDVIEIDLPEMPDEIPLAKGMEPFSKPDRKPGERLKHWDKKPKEKSIKINEPKDPKTLSDDDLYRLAASRSAKADDAAKELLERYESRVNEDALYQKAKQIIDNPTTIRSKHDTPITINRVDTPGEVLFKKVLMWRQALTDAHQAFNTPWAIDKRIKDERNKSKGDAAKTKEWINPTTGKKPSDVEIVSRPTKKIEERHEKLKEILNPTANRRRII